MFFSSERIKKKILMYIPWKKEGLAYIQYNAGETEASSLGTISRERLSTERMRGTPFPRGLSAETIVSFERGKMIVRPKAKTWLKAKKAKNVIRLHDNYGSPSKDDIKETEPRLSSLAATVTSVMKQMLCRLTSAWSDVESLSQKQTIRFRNLQIWCFHTGNEDDVGNVGF